MKISEPKISAYAIPGITITVHMVENAACNTWGIPHDELYKRTRLRKYIEARRAVFMFRRKKLGHTFETIATSAFDHSTVVYNVKQGITLLEVDRELQEKHRIFLSKLCIKVPESESVLNKY